MSATIASTCDICEAQDERPAHEFVLTLASTTAATATTGTVGQLLHRCGICGAAAIHEVTPAEASLLRCSGVTVLELPDPDALREMHPEDPPAGRPLHLDDLLDLHAALAAPGWFEVLLAGTAGVADQD